MRKLHFGPRYELLRELGAGGMGRVFLVRDAHLRKDVALKLLSATRKDGEALEQFQQELALLTKVEHPGIARAYDFGYAGGRPYFTSEFVPGETLERRAPSGAPAEILRIAVELAGALGFIHRMGILHLDVKPSNVMLPANGGRPVLIDFGLFRRGFGECRTTRVKGSLPYMAPERLVDGPLGPEADVYSLGVAIYRLLTDRWPHSPGLKGTSGSSSTPMPVPPSQLARVSSDVDSILLKCLALDPRARFRDGSELERALKPILEPVQTDRQRARSHPPSSVETLGRAEEISFVVRRIEELAASRQPALILVTGARGVGQTHFLKEVKTRAQWKGLPCYFETGHASRIGAPASLFDCLSAHVDEAAGKRWMSFAERLRSPRAAAHDETPDEERRLRWTHELVCAAEALREPLVLIADGLESFDEVSIALFCGLAKVFLSQRENLVPLLLVAGFREEGPSAPRLRELAEHALRSDSQGTRCLQPLGAAESNRLFELLGGRPSEELRGFGLLQKSHGLPSEIARLAAGHAPAPRDRDHPREHQRESCPAIELSKDERRLAIVQKLLNRPANAVELAQLAKVPLARARRALSSLAGRRVLTEADGAWHAGPAVSAVDPSGRECQSVHLAIAKSLLKGSSQGDGRRLAEAVEHLRGAGSRRLLLTRSLELAQFLKSTFQSRAAVRVLRELLEMLPRTMEQVRWNATMDLAELLARTGEVDEGIRLLGEILSKGGRVSESWRARALLRLATLHSRRGDFRRSDFLFKEGFEEARRKHDALDKAERLYFLNEHAAMKTFAGDLTGAKEVCERGLKLAREQSTANLREAALSLHATEGNIALRELRFEAAVDSFEGALEIAEATGSIAHRAVILNNLGIVHGQSDRYREAIGAFEEAKRICLRIDEGPSLAFIHGNLAVLHAKLGDFEATARSIGEAKRLGAAGAGRRQELFVEHHSGLALLLEGRFAEARGSLEQSLALADAIGDRLVASFDRVYRAECLLFEARYAEASRELRRSAADDAPAWPRRMAWARLAFLFALTGQHEEARAAATNRDAVDIDRAIPYLESWDRLYLGWAASLSGETSQALAQLTASERFFDERGLRPAHALSLWAKAELHMLQGDQDRAGEILDRDCEWSGLARRLRPLLAGRLILAMPPGARERERCADLLAEGGAALVGASLSEWSFRLDALRAEILEPSAARKMLSSLKNRRQEASLELPAKARSAYLESSHWKAWTRLDHPAPATASRPRPAGQTLRGRKLLARIDTGTAELAPTPDVGPRSGWITISKPMRELAAVLDRLRGSDLPVVILGETGSGKERIARIIHAESLRAARPFTVVDCAAIPGPLLEVELFGARAGAFSDLHRDRSGILAVAAGGTVLLDDVSSLGIDAQAKLLRVIDEKLVRPVGADVAEAIDVRFLFATSRSLEEEARHGRFRSDLLHRIQVLSLSVPPLRERGEDFEALVRFFIAESSAAPPAMGTAAIERLRKLEWPGNVRELKNVIARLKIESPFEITPESVDRTRLPSAEAALLSRDALSARSLPNLKESVEREYILHHLARLGGDTTALSKLLGVSRKHFYRRCQRLGIRLRARALRE